MHDTSVTDTLPIMVLLVFVATIPSRMPPLLRVYWFPVVRAPAVHVPHWCTEPEPIVLIDAAAGSSGSRQHSTGGQPRPAWVIFAAISTFC